MNLINPLYIITRCSNRPNFFSQTYKSIKSQTYPNITHIVTYDTPETLSYLNKYTDLFKVSVERKPRLEVAHFPYNLYCNYAQEMVAKMPSGWIMYLDDDDIFTSNTAVEVIMQHSTNPDNLIMWKVKFPECIKPSDRAFGKAVKSKGVPAISFAYHSQWIKDAIWDDRKGSDSRVVFALSKRIPKKCWINSVLTMINYKKGFGGLGNQNDLQKSIVMC